MNRCTQDEKLARHAEGLLAILADVMREDGTDKSSRVYQAYRKLDSQLRDHLYPLLSKYGLGEGPDAVRFGRQMLERVETACRFPELTSKSLVKLIPQYINEAFNGKSLGLIGSVPEIGSVRTIIPILALNGPTLKIEYVNYADCRREISAEDYGNIIRWSSQLKGLKLNRLIKNFIVTSPNVTPWAAVLVVAEGFAGNKIPIVDRLSMFVGQTFPVAKMHDEPRLYPQSTYLGLREQYDWLSTLVCGGIRRDEKVARRVSNAVKQDRTKLNGGDDADSFFKKFQTEAAESIRLCDVRIKEIGQVLNEIEIYVEDLRRLFKDVYNRKFKRLPTPPQKGAENLVLWTLCQIIETYCRLGFDSRDWISRLEKFGYSSSENEFVRNAFRAGERLSRETFIDTDELVREGEKKLRMRTKETPLEPTDVQLVPYKMAAAFGNETALSRLAEVFYSSGRYARGRRLKDEVEISEAKALKYVLEKLIYKNIDVAVNRSRIQHIRTCLGEFERVVDTTPYRSSHKATPSNDQHSPRKRNPKPVSEYDENATYESSSSCTDYSSSGCFVTTAALKSMSVGSYATAKAFVLMKRLRDLQMTADSRGRVLLSSYYKVAPGLVREIDAREDRSEIYSTLWRWYISPCCQWIREGRLADAERLYTDMVQSLLFLPIDRIVESCRQKEKL